MRFSFLPAALGNWRPPGAPSFVARRKIGEKGVPKGSKAALWNLAFIRGLGGETCVVYYEFAVMHFTRFRPVSSSQAPHPSFCLSGQKLSRSAAPPLPTKPTSLGFGGGPYWRPPLDPRGNVLGHSDVLCANRLAMVRVTRLRRLRRSAYPLASACCAAQKNSKTYATTRLPTTNQAGYSFSANEFAAVGAVQSSPWKQCGARHGRA